MDKTLEERKEKKDECPAYTGNTATGPEAEKKSRRRGEILYLKGFSRIDATRPT